MNYDYYLRMQEGPARKSTWEKSEVLTKKEWLNLKGRHAIIIRSKGEGWDGTKWDYWMYPFDGATQKGKEFWIEYTYYWHRTQYDSISLSKDVRLVRLEG